ncbi:MAG: hypothetical protein H7835_20285, partial [Magnetococcus sp. XQGC-1]
PEVDQSLEIYTNFLHPSVSFSLTGSGLARFSLTIRSVFALLVGRCSVFCFFSHTGTSFSLGAGIGRVYAEICNSVFVGGNLSGYPRQQQCRVGM